jgi:geranylgeranyl diphosphate synthase, type II
MGGSEGDALLTAACLELFQHWILIHDDIEDGSELRRGQPALHRKYGESLALNAGDALHARMWESLLKNEPTLGTERTLKVMKEFSRMVDETTEGQHMELSWVNDGRWDLGEDDYFEMCTKKTSWYTIASPCRLGAIVASASDADLETLLAFGIELGVGFQIQDDTLNLIGDPLKYGKASTDDLLEGKRTLMLLRMLELVDSNDKERVAAIMGKDREAKTEEDIQFVLSLLKRYDTISFAQRRAKEHVERALAALKTVEWKGDASSVSLLQSAARFAVERSW